MAAPVNKSTLPPPPPFYQLYTQPPPPPPSDDANGAAGEAAASASAASALPLDLYTPPPPLLEPFMKFGELHSSGAGFRARELPPDVPALYLLQRGSAAASAASAAGASTAAVAGESKSDAITLSLNGPYPDGVDYPTSLRVLNRQYLQVYLALLASLTPLPDSPFAPASADANPALFIEKHLQQLNDISANFAEMLSHLRGHQAAQTLLQTLMKQVERRKKKKEKIDSCIAEAKQFLASHGIVYPEGSTDIAPPGLSVPFMLSSNAAVKSESARDANSMDESSATPADRSLQPDATAQLRAFLEAIPDD